MTEAAGGDRPQDVGRRHRTIRKVAARPLDDAERLALLDATPLDAYRHALAAASWLYGADELAAVILRDVLAELTPAPGAQLGLDGKPLPARSAVPIADRLKLWALALELAGELGLTADSRRRIGLELTPPATPPGRSVTARGGPRRRRVDYGGA